MYNGLNSTGYPSVTRYDDIDTVSSSLFGALHCIQIEFRGLVSFKDHNKQSSDSGTSEEPLDTRLEHSSCVAEV
jgi:hypothetical protein